MPYAMINSIRCCWEICCCFYTSRGAERTTLITRKQISVVATVNPIVKKEVHLLKKTNNLIQSMVLTKYLGYINRSKFYISYVTFYRKPSIMI